MGDAVGSPIVRDPARFGDDTGSAALEFITAGFILLVPLVYLVLALAAIQAGAFAIEGGARQAARVYVQGSSPSDAVASADRAVAFALADYGVDPARVSVSVACSPHPARCLTRRGFVEVDLRAQIALPFAPPAIRGRFPLSVPLEATATDQVSRFWGSR